MSYLLVIVSAVFVLTCVVGLQKGDPCTMESTGRAGKCLHLSKCASAVEDFHKGIDPQNCGLEGTVPIVCCPTVKLVEGSGCIMEATGMPGACSRLSDCPAAMLAASKGNLPQICNPYSSATEGQLVCCSEPCSPVSKILVPQEPTGSRAADYCIELAGHIHPCQRTSFGWTRRDICPAIPVTGAEYHETRIYSISEAPSWARFGTGSKDSIAWERKGGTLISDRWVLTTAYVIEGIGSENLKFVGLGGRFNPSTPDEIFDVARIVIHPEFVPSISNIYNNIALVQLDRWITFSSSILPACLHTGTPLPNSDLIYTGWDLTLQVDVKTSIRIIPGDECSRVFPAKGPGSLHPEGVKHDIQFCGRRVNAVGPCRVAITGSPLTVYNGARVSCTRLLVGLISTLDPKTCTTAYTRVSAFIPWIESVVWP